jgi:hypothetical protein
MPNNSSKPAKPDYGFPFFLQGLAELMNRRYEASARLFEKALIDYEVLGGSTKKQIYHFFRFFKEWSNALSFYEDANLESAQQYFSSTFEVALVLPEPARSELMPPVQVFVKLIPLEDQLKKLFDNPKDFQYLSEELPKIMNPLCDLMFDSAMENISQELYTLIRAEVNICMALEYLLGKLPLEGISALVRTDEVERLDNASPNRLVQWVLTQEQLSLIEIGFDRTGEFIPSLMRLARELTGHGSLTRLDQIDEETKAGLLKLITPLSLLQDKANRLEMIPDAVRESIESLTGMMRDYRSEIREFLKGKVTTGYQKVAFRFPTPDGVEWIELLIRFLDAYTIEATVKGVTQKLTYKELGFEDSRTNKPDHNWHVLRYLAEYEGKLTWRYAIAGRYIKRAIYVLRKRLKLIFGIPGDPFYPYDEYKSYKVRFKMALAENYSAEEDPWQIPISRYDRCGTRITPKGNLADYADKDDKPEDE